MPTPLIAAPAPSLSGTVTVPGDKSMSHRALIFGALAQGRTRITGLLEADDVLRTGACLRALGVSIEKAEDGSYIVDGRAWQVPARTLYCGNAGTGVRLLMGAVAGQKIGATFDGDRSLRSRPMGRVLDPLSEMGVTSASEGGKLPVTLLPGAPQPMTYRLPKASAQVKSAILLAALGAEGETVIEEPTRSRDHTEKMLAAFGVPLRIDEVGKGRRLTLQGPAGLVATDVDVPADPSSAAFPLCAAAIVPGSDVTVQGVLMNPLRTGLFEVLREMGADLTFENEREAGGEALADIRVRHRPLQAVTVPPTRVPAMVDEYPVLAVVAAFAAGTSRMDGLGELRVKESDRLSATAALLRANGATVRTGEDWLEVDGAAGVPGGGMVETHDDHRIAMSSLVLGLGAQTPVQIDDGDMIGTSFTGFADLMATLGGQIGPAAG